MINGVFIVGMALIIGVVIAAIFEKYRIPQVVGFIIVGLFLGKSFLHVFEGDIVETLTPLVNLTLGLIGCVIGAELKASTLNKFAKSIYSILFFEGVLAFAAVTAVIGLISGNWPLALVLGAIASATDPASTMSVLWQYKAKGPVTRTVTSIVALDDGLALIIYGLVSVFSKSLMMDQSFSWTSGVAMPLFEIVKCFALGILVGFLVVKIISFFKEDSLVLTFVFAAIAVVVGLSLYLEIDLILSSMSVGATIANIYPKISEKLFKSIREMMMPLYILFFILVGAKFDVMAFTTTSVLVIVFSYVVVRSVGKVAGAMFGGYITGAKPAIVKYSGICLMTQGGIAMGLALSIHNNWASLGARGDEAGLLPVNIVAATTLVVQLLGPFATKWGIRKAEEENRNVTKEDVIGELHVKDVMIPRFQSISEAAHLPEILNYIRESESFNFLVVDEEGKLFGQI